MFRCDVCGDEFDTPQRLGAHRRHQHKGNVKLWSVLRAVFPNGISTENAEQLDHDLAVLDQIRASLED